MSISSLQPCEESGEESWSETRPKKQARRKAKKSAPTTPPVQHEYAVATVQITQSLTASLISMPPSVRLLVCSIGNPGQYINTFHSAGHTVLSTLATQLSYPSFQKSRAHGNGLLSAGEEFTLWQSSSLMNISGAGVAAAWKQFVKECRGEEARLVVVHDELELGLGQVRVKEGTASPKGHNGLKSIKESVRGEWMRIGVGIGRPVSREADVVASFVLKKMGGMERAKVEGSTGRVLEELRRLSG